MMSRKGSFWCKVAALVLGLVLIVPILAACGSSKENTATPVPTTAQTTQPPTTTPPMTTPPATTPAATTLPFVDDPVKIGAIQDWSGPTAMAGWIGDSAIAFAEWYWNEKQGGIVAGDVRRPIKIIRYDNKSQIALTSAMAQKALLDGCVAVVWGGVTNEHGFPVVEVTDPAGVLYSMFFNMEALFDDYTYAVNSFYSLPLRIDLVAKIAVQKVKAKTVGFLGYDVAAYHDTVDIIEARLKELDPDIKILFKEYHSMSLTDLSPYLTKIRYEKPDVLICDDNGASWMAMATQMPGLGGWGDIKVIAVSESADFAKVEKAPGADGWYFPMMWMAGIGTPGARAFGEAWAEKCQLDPGWCKKYSPLGSTPMPNHPLMYNPILTVIKSIELAGSTDRLKVAQAAVSGKIEYDSPLGLLSIGKDGRSNLSGFYVHLKDGKRVIVDLE